jgi:rubrerythrin
LKKIFIVLSFILTLFSIFQNSNNLIKTNLYSIESNQILSNNFIVPEIDVNNVREKNQALVNNDERDEQIFIIVTVIILAIGLYILIKKANKNKEQEQIEKQKMEAEQQRLKDEKEKAELLKKLTLEHEVIKEILSTEAPEIFKCPTCGANVTKKNTDKFCMYCGAKLK